MNRKFSVGYHAYLRVRAMKSSLNLGSCANMSHRYCGSFEVLERIYPVAYRPGGLLFPHILLVMFAITLGAAVGCFGVILAMIGPRTT